MLNLLVKDRFHPGRWIAKAKDTIRVFYTHELRSLTELFSALSATGTAPKFAFKYELQGLQDTLCLDRLNLPPPSGLTAYFSQASGKSYRLAGSFAVSSALITLGLFSGLAYALPQGYESVEGNIQFQQSGSTLNVTTDAHKSIAQYQQFNVGQGETVNFNLPSAQSAILNRVVGPDPSQIMGKINSNGQVFLTNPNGIVFGQGAQVNVAGLLASTLSINNQDFMAGQYTFKQEQGKTSAWVKNQGQITTEPGGFAILAGGSVENTGNITSPGGSIHLAVGKQLSVAVDANLSVQLTIDEALQETVQDAQTAIANSGTLSANNGGTVKAQARLTEDLYQRSINNTGHIEAKGLGDLTGEVTFQADKGLVVQAGTIDTSNQTGKGGTVRVLGDYVALDPGSVTNASGQTGGGEILIGGDYQGKGQTQRAKQTYVGDDAELKADALNTGNGGKVIVWADEATWFYGDISAKGGSLSGDGGLAEVSGKDMLYFYGSVNLLAPHGQKGTLLLDPENLFIISSSLTSPDLWLDASQITGLSNGQAVATWSDTSGNGNHATQGTGSAQPLYITNVLNGKPVLRFDGNDYLSTTFVPQTGSGSRTLIAVIANGTTNVASYNHILHYGTASPNQSYGLTFKSGGGATNIGNHYWGSGFSSSQAPTSSPLVLVISYNGTTDNLFANGIAQGSKTVALNTGSAQGLVIGSRISTPSEFLQGDIAEVLAFDYSLSTPERQYFEQYLGGKYGISVPGSSATSVMTQSQIETLSQTANVVLSADKDVTIGTLDNNVLNLQGIASLTITADANNDGIGNVTMNPADTLRTEGGNITISGVSVTLGHLNTTGVSGNQTGGNILVEAEDGLMVGTVTTKQADITLKADADNDTLGTLITSGQLLSNNGNINLTGAVFNLPQPINAGLGTVRLTTTLDNFHIIIPTFSLWLDASQITGLSNGQSVATWADASGNGYNATQGIGSAQPLYITNGLNGMPILRFDGNDYLSTTFVPQIGSGSRTLIAVITNGTTNVASYNHILHYGTASPNQSYGLTFKSGGGATNIGNHYWGSGFSSSQAPTSSPLVLVISYNGTTDSLFANGIAQGSTTVALNTGSAQGLVIGSRISTPSEFLQGDIAEVLAFDYSLSASEQQFFEQYLGGKYGISVPGSSATSILTKGMLENITAGNVIVSANKDITLGSGSLAMNGATALTLHADANNDGIGNVTMNPADTLRTEGGNITVSGVDVTLGNLNTAGLSGNQTGGNILVEAEKNLTVGTVTTRQAQITLSADADNNASGVLLTNGQIVSNNGNINLTSAFFGLHQPVNAGTGTVRLTTTLDNFYIMSPSLWLDASQITGLSNGQNVSLWNDASGNNYDALQGTGSSQPLYIANALNGLPVLRFDGGDVLQTNSVTIDYSSGVSVFAVWKRDNSGGTAGLVTHNQPSSYINFWMPTSSQLRWESGIGGTNLQQTYQSISPNTWYIASGVNNTLYINGNNPVTVGNTGIPSSITSNIYIGEYPGFGKFPGDVAEVVIFNSSLPNEQRQLFEQYLGNKYGISVPGSSATSVLTKGMLENITAGNVVVAANKDVAVGTGSIAMAGSTALTLQADRDGNNTGNIRVDGTLAGNNTNITLSGSQVSILNSVSAGTGTVSIQPSTAKAIQVAGTTDQNDSIGALDISAAELRRITAGTLSIGNAALASNISMAGNLDLSGVNGTAGVYNLAINTAGNFSNNGYTLNLGRDALYFDGVNDFVNMGDAFDMGTNDLTWGAWIKTTGNNLYSGIIGKAFFGSKSGRYSIHLAPNGTLAAISQQSSGNIEIFQGSTVINDGNWHFVSAVFDRDVGIRIYVNGVDNGFVSNNSAGQNFNTTDNFTIGYYNLNPTGYISGLIDNGFVYNRALSSSELTALYNNGSGQAGTTINSGLIGSYSFSEGSGTTTANSVGGNNGTLTNGPAWVRANNLTVNAGGTVNTGNILSDGGQVSITSAGNITVSGNVQSIGRGTVTMATTANNANIALGGNVQGDSGVSLAVHGAGTMTRTAGTLAGTTVNLTSGTGNIGTSSNRIQTAAATLTANTGGSGNVYITEANALVLGASGVGNLYDLQAGGNITVNGIITANNVNWTTTANNGSITSNAPVTATGAMALTTHGSGSVYAVPTANKFSANTLTFNSTSGWFHGYTGINQLTFSTTGNVSVYNEGTGGFTTTASSAGNILLYGALLTTSGDINATGNITFHTIADWSSVAIGGSIQAGSAITFNLHNYNYGDRSVTQTAGTLTAQAITFNNATTIGSSGSYVQTATNTLTVNNTNVAGNVFIREADNIVLNASAASNRLNLAAGGNITLAGNITAPNLLLQTTANNGNILLGASAAANTGITLIAHGSGNIQQTAGTLTAGTLTVSSGSGDISLRTQVAQLSGDTLGTLSVTETDDLTVTGSGVSAETVSLTTLTGHLTLAGQVTGNAVHLAATTGSILDDSDADAPDVIAQTALSLTASESLGSDQNPLEIRFDNGTGGVSLNAANAWLTAPNGLYLGSGSVSGQLSVVADSTLGINGSLSAGSLSLLARTGDIMFNAPISTGSFTLESAGNLYNLGGTGQVLQASGDSVLRAGGVIGTLAAPVNVSVNNGTLSVLGLGRQDNVSVNINGRVLPSSRLSQLGAMPGLVLFNGFLHGVGELSGTELMAFWRENPALMDIPRFEGVLSQSGGDKGLYYRYIQRMDMVQHPHAEFRLMASQSLLASGESDNPSMLNWLVQQRQEQDRPMPHSEIRYHPDFERHNSRLPEFKPDDLGTWSLFYPEQNELEDRLYQSVND